MAKKIAVEKGRISNFEGLVTLTVDRVILCTVVQHSLTSANLPNFIEIEGTFCGRTYVRTHIRMYKRTFETSFIKSNLLKSRPKNVKHTHHTTI